MTQWLHPGSLNPTILFYFLDTEIVQSQKAENDESLRKESDVKDANKKSLQINPHFYEIYKHKSIIETTLDLNSDDFLQFEKKFFLDKSDIHFSHNIPIHLKKPKASSTSIPAQVKIKSPYKKGNSNTLQPLFELSFEEQDKKLMMSVSPFLTNKNIISSNSFEIVPPHMSNLHVTFDKLRQQLKMEFTLLFSISVCQSIYPIRSKDFVQKFLDLMDVLYFNPGPYGLSNSKYDKSVSSFYSKITTHTKRYHTVEKENLNLNGINKTLLPFQVDSVKWMLEHEGKKLDPQTGEISDCHFSSSSRDFHKILDTISPGWIKIKRLHNQNSEEFWFNQYSGSFCTSKYLSDYLNLTNFEKPRAKGFLCEEMGLGKTLEITSLIKLNPRILISDELQTDYFDPSRKFKQSKATLIVCPETIISQWYNEISVVCPDLKVYEYKGITILENLDDSITPTMVANELNTHDVILTSYNTLAREVTRATFIPTSRPKRKSSNYDRVDYSSPLMLLEFHRLVLDEAQLASLSISKVAYFARIIPRTHTWCVSGTLIRRNLADLHSLITSQRLSPLDLISIQQWNQLPIDLFESLITSRCLRHTKEMVGDQVKLPKQTRIMLKSPFTSIESDNYHDLFSRFLQQVGLNENGEPIAEGFDVERSKIGMKSWYNRLRMVCCHALLNGIRRNIALDSFVAKGGKSSKNDELIIGTLNDVLADLLTNNEAEVHNAFYNYIRNYIKIGKIKEFLREPEKSVPIFLKVIEIVNNQLEIYRKCEVDPQSTTKSWALRIRHLLSFLHQAYFMLASAHYQHYRPMHPLPDTFDDLNDDFNVEEDNEVEEDKVVDVETLTEDEKKHYGLEIEYYSKADSILNQLLEDSLKRTADMIKKVDTTFDVIDKYRVKKLPSIPTNQEKEKEKEKDDQNKEEAAAEDNSFYELPRVCISFGVLKEELKNHSTSLEISFVINRAEECMDQLNEQAIIINYWFKRLIEYQKVPVIRNENADKTGEEYKSTLISQDESQAYIDQLQLILEDREKALNVTEDSFSYKSSFDSEGVRKIQRVFDDNRMNKTKLTIELEQLRKYFAPQGTSNARYSFRTSILELVNELQGYLPDSYKYQEISEMIKLLKSELNRQMKNLRNMKSKYFDILNDAFNTKVSYFKALQSVSDSLVNYTPENIGSSPKYAALVDLEETEKELEKEKSKLTSLNARLNYLKTLNTNGDEAGNDNSKDDVCVICSYRILVGTLTPCGHKYCRECLKEWMKTKKACPLCKKKLSVDELYNFTYSRGGLKGDVVESVHDHKEEVKILHNNNNNGDAGDNDDDDDVEGDTVVDTDDVNDLDRLKLLKNRRLLEKDMDFVYEGLPVSQLREISNIRLKRSYGTKVDMIIRQAKYLVKNEPGVQILIFSQWNQFLILLGRALKYEGVEFRSWMDQGSKRVVKKNMEGDNDTSTDSLRGKLKVVNSKLNENIIEFKRNSSITCFLLNTIAQAAGLTFTNASHVFLCEPMVNLSFELQAVSRIHRIGQTKETKVWNFIIENTIEESIAYLGTKKRIQAAKVRKGNEVEEIDDNVLEAKEMMKVTETGKKDGEVIADEDLWATFFAARAAKVIDSVLPS